MARDVNGHKKLLRDLLRDQIAIPDYQREYVWKRKIITKLLDDLIDHCRNYPNDAASPYFLGSLMLVPEGGGKPNNVTDGQQRLTAITCISAAIRDQLLVEGEYQRAWQFHCTVIENAGDKKLILHNSGDDFGTDAQVAWARQPRDFSMKPKVKMKLELGTPPRLRSGGAIKLSP